VEAALRECRVSLSRSRVMTSEAAFPAVSALGAGLSFSTAPALLTTCSSLLTTHGSTAPWA
jgi:hypothetical protein